MNEAEFTAPAPAGSSPVEYASFARRLGAALLDSLVWLIGLTFFNPVALITNEAIAAVVALLILSAWFNYFAVCEWLWGQTIGKNATGIGVVPLEGGKVTWQAAALRNLLRLVDLPLAMVGAEYLIVRGSPRRQRLGDRAAKTIVIREAQPATAPPAASESGQTAARAAAPTAAEIFGDAAEALGRQPAAASTPPARPAAVGSAPAPAARVPPEGIPPGAQARPKSSWTAAGFPYADWELRRTVLGLLGGLLLALFVPLLVLPFDPDLESTGGLLAAQALFAGSLILVSIGIASGEGRWNAAKALAALGLRRFRASAFGWMALAYLAYFLFVALYGALITPPEQEDIARDLGLDTGVAGAIAVVFVIAVIAPISEEIFFRGMLFGGLRRRLPTVAAAVLSALVFGALHAPTGPTAVPPLIAFGFVLALLYERSGSLGPPIILHAVNNSLALALTA